VTTLAQHGFYSGGNLVVLETFFRSLHNDLSAEGESAKGKEFAAFCSGKEMRRLSCRSCHFPVPAPLSTAQNRGSSTLAII
jgi:hypothetical protein